MQLSKWHIILEQVCSLLWPCRIYYIQCMYNVCMYNVCHVHVYSMYFVFFCAAVRTDEMLAQVNITKSEGAVGVYDEKFMEMERKLLEISDIIDKFNQTAADMSNMDTSFVELK